MKPSTGKRPSPGERLELDVGKPAPQGDMVSRWGNYVVFLEGGIPGEKVKAKMVKVESNHGRGRVTDVLAPSPERIPPPCPVFLRCGGCRYQHAQEGAQRRWKSQILSECLGRQAEVLEASPAYRYRTKAQPGVQIKRGKGVLSLLVRESHERVETPDCLLYHTQVKEILDLALKDLPLDAAMSVRNIVVRAAPTTGQGLVALVSRVRLGRKIEGWASSLIGKSGIQGVVENVNPQSGAVIWGPESHLLAGKDEVKEKVAGIRFRIGAGDFFQASPEGAEALVAHVKKRLGERKSAGTLWDLYAGVGLFGLCLAPGFKKVILVEENEEALKRATISAKEAGFRHVEIRTGTVDYTLRSLDAGPDDAVIVDPPRSGLSPKMKSLLRTAGFRDFLYVSCDPATLARDLESLQGTYDILDVTGFDLFPQTAHVEAVVHLRAKRLA